MEHKENCICCGAKLEYLEEAKEMECIYCHKKVTSQVQCENGHFICDECHSKNGIDLIIQFCKTTEETNPYVIAKNLFLDQRIHLHGPEHHVLVPAVLLAAYYNKTKEPQLKERYLALVKDRGSKIPGGFCGYAGCCGAGVGVGIFFSILEQISPLNHEKWGEVNQVSGETLLNIGKYAGPRCCKRNTFVAFETANHILQEKMGVSLIDKPMICGWFAKNEECLKEECAYYPQQRKEM